MTFTRTSGVGRIFGEILTLFEVVWRWFVNCLGIIFGVKRPTLVLIVSFKDLSYTSKFEIFRHNLTHFWWVIFGQIGGESNFLAFLKVVL